jgi:hypothetical protein
MFSTTAFAASSSSWGLGKMLAAGLLGWCFLGMAGT